MSQIEVDKIIPQSGNATQLGESGDTITIPAGATITNNGTANGFGSADTEKVKVSANDTTAGFLNGKLVAGTNISLTEGTDGGNETLTAALTGTIATAQIADDAITLAKMASGTDGNIISYDASGNPVAVATGNDGQVLTSTGAGSPPAFETPAGGVWVRTHYTQIGTNGATQIDFTGLSSSYEVYKFYFVNIRPETDDVYMKFFMNVNGSFQTSDYGYAIRLVDSDQTLGSAASPEDNAFARVQVNGTGNATGETLNGELTIFDPSGTTNKNVITTNFNSINTGGKSSSNVGVISNMSSAAALTGIRIKFSSGKMLAGGLIIGYGLNA